MNRVRRKELNKILDEIAVLRDRVWDVMNDEQEAFDNLPESLQYSEQGVKMENTIDCLQTALNSFDEINEALTGAQE